MDRRVFLRLTGLLAASAAALKALPAAAQGMRTDEPMTPVVGPRTALQPPGMYEITGRVRLQEPLVAISGITNAQQITWAGDLTRAPSASFSSYEYFSEPWRMPEVRVRGGQLEALAVRPVEMA